MPTYSHDIFISYNRNDKSFVEFLVHSLELAGLKCFQDVTGLKIFDKLDASLKAAISNSHWLMAIISPSYLQSYWCLFEALEAIRGQDIEQRFLPIIVRYTPGDQSLDEDFVLKALGDLDEQIKNFETQIVRMKAYELSAKLEKLSFVRGNLPGVFRQIHERIFPQFSLWDEQVVRSTLRQLISRLAPKASVDIDAIPLNFERLAATPVVIPRLRTLPTLLWKAWVGRQAWKNSPLIVGNDVLVGSAGRRWNKSDTEDGIYCLDAETGTRKWFAPAPADTNRLMVSKGTVITGCDDGTVLAVSVRDGAVSWRARLDSGIVGGPIKMSANIGYSMAKESNQAIIDPVLLVTFGGGVFLLDLTTGREIQHIDLGRQVIGAVAVAPIRYRQPLWVPCIDGILAFLEYDDIHVNVALVREVALQYSDRFAENGYSVACLCAEPLFAENVIVQGLVRQTYYDEPPLVALDAASGMVRWTASIPEGQVVEFGNLRGAPVVIDREVIFSTAYSKGLSAVSLDDGKLLWSVALGQGMFEQWCGPVARGRSVYLGRHDGYIHKVDTARHRREWSVFLGNSTHAGAAVSGDQRLPEFSAPSAWLAGGSAPILATPALDRGRLYVGTYEGYLYCLANLGEDTEDS